MSPRPLEGSEDFTRSLRLVGELLEAEDTSYAIVVVWGAALQLKPTDTELVAAAEWVKQPDASSQFPGPVDQILAYVRAHR